MSGMFIGVVLVRAPLLCLCVFADVIEEGVPSESPKNALRDWINDTGVNGSPSRRPGRRILRGPFDSEDPDESDYLRSRSTSCRSSVALRRSSSNDSTSMASTTATDSIPPLIRGTSTGSSSAASADTDMASSILGDGYILESQEGVLTVPHRYLHDADLLCPFQILDCDRVFDDIISFKMHVFSHFRGHELPTCASCFLCDNKYSQQPGDDSALAWNTMLSHLVHEHFRRGQQLATVRTNFALMRWMYNRRLITCAQFKRTQMVPVPVLLPGALNRRSHIMNMSPAPEPPSAPPPASILAHLAQSVGHQHESFIVNAGRRAERRRLDATRTMIRARSYM